MLPLCNDNRAVIPATKTYEADRNRDLYRNDVEAEQAQWVWALFAAFLAPEVMAFFRSLRVCLFKSVVAPPFMDFAFVALMESLHVIGVAILVFLALPQMDTTHALALTNCLAFVPGIHARSPFELPIKTPSSKVSC